MKQSSERLGTINIAKGEDDGAVFRNFIKESRRHTDRRGLSTDAIAEMLEKGKVSLFELSYINGLKNHILQFIPFCSKVCLSNPPESHSIYMTIVGPNYGPVSLGAFHRTSPSPDGYRKWIPNGWSSAHIPFSRRRSNT